jgi:cytidine deaminase
MTTFEEAVAPFPEPVRRRISTIHRSSEFRGVIDSSDANEIASESGMDLARLMTTLLPIAALYARPPVSNFRVGCISRGTTTGNLYYGSNLEFAGQALSFTVHAEQSSVTNAWLDDEEGVDLIATSAAPCGYCRQFLNELTTADSVTIAMPQTQQTLSELLPSSFGPRDLGIERGLMKIAGHGLTIDDVSDALTNEALAAANASYAPYSRAYGGVALRAKDDRTFSGRYAENAAFNPSISPLQVAMSRMNLFGYALDDIAEAVLVETEQHLHAEATRVVLGAVTQAPLRIVTARNSSQA